MMKKNIQSSKRHVTAPSMMMAVLIIMAHHMITTSATSCHIISARPAFYPHTITNANRSSTKQSASSTKFSRRQYGTNKSADDVIQTVGLRKKTKSKMIDLDDNLTTVITINNSQKFNYKNLHWMNYVVNLDHSVYWYPTQSS
mmetsp:Transcript_10919/g.21711  ORF Transcript_10919/g.21711 Transcript_10919/m.21711 type:complete len:143 (-) Transcript_10919:428-856(-)